MNLAANLARTVASSPDRPVIRTGESPLTYRDLDAASARVAGLLRARGIGADDRVAVMTPNVAEFAMTYYGVLRLGAVVVPMNPQLKAREVAYYLGDSGASVLFAWHAVAAEAGIGAKEAGADVIAVDPATFGTLLAGSDPVPAIAERADADTAVILYTSGTTGQPKGAELTHANLRTNAEISGTDLLELGPDDVVFAGLPLFHSFGQTCTLNAAVAAGASLAMLARFDPTQALRVMSEHGVTAFAGVPTMYGALLHVPDRADVGAVDLRVCMSGGAALPVEVLRQFENAFGCAVLEGYGLSETSPVASFNHPHRERKPGTIGTPVRGVEMRVIDADGNPLPSGESGEIEIRGHNIMKGYWRKPEATAESISPDGWFSTGDIGRVDDDGYYSIVDRKKDLIIRGGYNVYPREIEEVFYEHPAVAEVAVVGIAHDQLGEEVGAAVALKPGVEVSAEELRAYVKGQVAAYKYPRHVWLVDSLPKGPTGKILKREIVVADIETAR